MSKFVVLLDNGHGKDTPGKRSPLWEDGTQLLEYRYTRQIVDFLIEKFKRSFDYPDVELIKLVPEEEDISLRERCKRANNYASEYGVYNCLGISVHVNAFDGIASGWQLHTYLGESLSDRYAEIVWNSFKKDLEGVMKIRQYSHQSVDYDANFAILRDTRCPFILTENGFMDNEEECKFLMSDVGMNLIIDNHIKSIVKCYSYWLDNRENPDFSLGLVSTKYYQNLDV